MSQLPTVALDNNLFATFPEKLAFSSLKVEKAETNSTNSVQDVDDDLEILNEEEGSNHNAKTPEPTTTCTVTLVFQGKYWSGNGNVPGNVCSQLHLQCVAMFCLH